MKKQRRASQTFLRWLIWRLLCIIIFIGRFIPLSLTNGLGWILGNSGYYLLPRTRKRVLENLGAAFKDEMPDAGKKKIARGVFVNQARNLLELLILGFMKKETRGGYIQGDIRGEAHLRRAMENGNGVILVSGHISNWEALAIYLAEGGYSLSVIAAPIYDDRIGDIMINLRKNYGVETIVRGTKEAGRQLLNVVRNNKILIILIDQDIKASGVFIDFFGREAFTADGLISFGLKRDLKFVFAHTVRERDGRLYVNIDEIKTERTGDHKSQTFNLLQSMTRRFEEVIRENPDQWVWMHNRWKTKRSEN